VLVTSTEREKGVIEKREGKERKRERGKWVKRGEARWRHTQE
jgi:hypothetical protein